MVLCAMNFKTVSNHDNTVEGFCLIKSMDKKTTAKGVPYLDMVLTDSSGEISAKLWDYKENIHTGFGVNSIVKVRGTVSVFNDAEQLRVERIRPSIASDELNIGDFVPSASFGSEEMYNEIIRTVENFKSGDLKLLTKTILEQNKERLMYWPAALKLHHALRGGLLFHTLSILKLAQGVSRVYPFIDTDLLYTGVILHDIAKIDELQVSELGISTAYSADGELVGHLVRGAIQVGIVGKELGIDPDVLMLVEHMLISHHGEPEFGVAQRPKFLEAEVLSLLDQLDARVFIFSSCESSVSPGEFTSRQWALDNRRLYNHGRHSGDSGTDPFVEF